MSNLPAHYSAPLNGDEKLDQENLYSTIQTVDYFVRRNYLAQLPACPVIPLATPDTTKNIRLFGLKKSYTMLMKTLTKN